jgi:hypothetical protein
VVVIYTWTLLCSIAVAILKCEGEPQPSVQDENSDEENWSGEQKSNNPGNEALIYFQAVPRRVEQSNDVCHELEHGPSSTAGQRVVISSKQVLTWTTQIASPYSLSQTG